MQHISILSNFLFALYGGNTMNKTKNRWLIATSAVGIHLSIGSVYAWSVFTNPLHQTFQWSLTEISLTFSIAILF